LKKRRNKRRNEGTKEHKNKGIYIKEGRTEGTKEQKKEQRNKGT
jgi:hypothetical protein